MDVKKYLCKINRTHIQFLLILLMIILFNSILTINRKNDFYVDLPLLLINHSYPMNFSSIYENIILLSCSSYSYTSVYCYYLPYVALAWRRLGFEPVVFLVGSEKEFNKMPLINLLKNDLKIRYHLINVDSAHSIAVSQIIRLFGGFLTYENQTKKDLFILIGDVDLVPIKRHPFEIYSHENNYILAVNAYCCPNDKFTYENLTNIHYYPMSYVGMKKYLWKKIFLPLDRCSLSKNLTIDFIACVLKERMNVSIPTNVTKPGQYWDLDQKLLSFLIARAEDIHNVQVDKRRRGDRLDFDNRFLSFEFDNILDYDDVHLVNRNENILYRNKTWHILRDTFLNIFYNNTIQLLQRYHYQTADFIKKRAS